MQPLMKTDCCLGKNSKSGIANSHEGFSTEEAFLLIGDDR